MTRKELFAILIAALSLTAGFLIGYGLGLQESPKPATLPACTTEDSSNCVWDARTHGNGEGRSFVDLNGHTYYLEGK